MGGEVLLDLGGFLDDFDGFFGTEVGDELGV